MMELAIDMAAWGERTAAPPPVRPLSPVKQGRVLVAHDHSWMRRVLARSLERAGYTVAVARNASELLDHLDRREPFAAVVVALELPDLSGLELLATLGALAGRIPVIVLGGEPAPAVRDASALLGAVLLGAPFDVTRLTAALRSAGAAD